MIRGLDRFREFFADYGKEFVLIGGVACHEWLATLDLEFRATKDMDVVLLIEALNNEFVGKFWEFIEAGQYQLREKADAGRELYRFSKPQDNSYPVMIEIFSRKPQGIELSAGQHVVPVQVDDGSGSLSAILLDEAYYNLIREQRTEEKGLPFVNPAALIPLKARAWLDLSARKKKGEKVDSRDIAKHRADAFRIANTLPGKPGPRLHKSIQSDLKSFLAAFPAESGEWPAILASLERTFPGTKLNQDDLIKAIEVYFRLQ